MAQLTQQQQASLREADKQGRAFVTLINGRVAIILPAARGDDETAQQLERGVAALENAGI